MPIEIAKMLMAGEKATIVGPGVVKFEAMAQGLGGAKAVGAGVAATGQAAGVGAGQMVVTSAGASSVPAGLLSGKVLGFSLGSLNPWVLLALGIAGGYMIAK
ncbi:MAG: hypothetical protein HQL88_01525, partial [Magnetococcales bacterium]|nr:hypothetical protein [Magnetococcales bacterium]